MPNYKILFINAIDTRKGLDDYPALGIGYLISSLRNKFGHDLIKFKVIEDNVEAEIKTFNPNIVCISSVTPNYNLAIEYARIAKEYKLPVIVGAVHISMLPYSLTEDMDVGVLGEGEETICDLFELYKIEGVFDKQKLQYIKGIVYRDKQGNFNITHRRELIQPLDSIPMPCRDLLEIKTNTYMFTSRGCPYKCIFCSSTRFWDKVRLHSAEYVVNEIEYLINQYNTKSIYFCDDLFIVSVKRIELILKLLEERNLLGKTTFICNCSSNLIDEKKVSLLKKMGVIRIFLGFESGCDKILKYLKNNTISVEDHENAIKIIRKYGIEIIGAFIIGSPQESKDDISETINFIKKNKLINTSIYPLVPLPGTPLWEYAKEKNLVNDDMNWNLLNFSDFQHNPDTCIHLSEKLTRNEIYGYIQLFGKWRRKYIIKSLLKESLLNPLKIPDIAIFLISKIIAKIKLAMSLWALPHKK